MEASELPSAFPASCGRPPVLHPTPLAAGAAGRKTERSCDTRCRLLALPSAVKLKCYSLSPSLSLGNVRVLQRRETAFVAKRETNEPILKQSYQTTLGSYSVPGTEFSVLDMLINPRLYVLIHLILVL